MNLQAAILILGLSLAVAAIAYFSHRIEERGIRGVDRGLSPLQTEAGPDPKTFRGWLGEVAVVGSCLLFGAAFGALLALAEAMGGG